MSDQTSLDLLNDIVPPAAVSWWPLAPGWYVLGSILGLALAALAWRAWNKWRQNQYRRLALLELASIRASSDGLALGRLPALLKRTALSAWPRPQVASLTGPEWYAFLDRTGGTSDFGSRVGQMLDRLAYGSDPREKPSAVERETLLKAAEHWIRRHHNGSRIT